MSDAVSPGSAFRAGVRSRIVESLHRWSRHVEAEQTIPRELIEVLARCGYLGSCIDTRYGGQALSCLELGILHEETARVHGSVENFLTVMSMSAAVIQRFAERQLAMEWLPLMARGERLVAFTVTEPRAGIDGADVQTRLRANGDGWRVTGEKLWISFGQIADAYLVLGRVEDRTLALLIRRDTPGLEVQGVGAMLGLKGNALARIHFRECFVPRRYALGSSFPGLTPAILLGIDVGRFMTAWGSLGIAQGALDLAVEYARTHYAMGRRICEHQLVQKMLTETIVAVKAARLLCESSTEARQAAIPEMIGATLIAKYAASRAARLASDHAVQILGARGCHEESVAPRFFRDAKIMEIIEGTTQIHEIQIALDYIAHVSGTLDG